MNLKTTLGRWSFKINSCLPSEIIMRAHQKCAAWLFLEPTCGFWPCQLLQLRGRHELKKKKELDVCCRCFTEIYSILMAAGALSLCSLVVCSSLPVALLLCVWCIFNDAPREAAFFLLVTAPKRTMTFLIWKIDWQGEKRARKERPKALSF